MGMHHAHAAIHSDHAAAGRLMRAASMAAVATAVVLMLLKFYAWVQTDSVSILSSLMDSALDIAMSLTSFLAIRYSLMPPDDDHRFGHTAAEDVAALTQSAFTAGSALFIGVAAAGRLSHPEPVAEPDLGIGIMLISTLATIALVVFQKYVVRKTGSTAISADSLHYFGDVLMNASIILAVLLSGPGGMGIADPLMALLIAAYIAAGAFRIGRMAFDKLMDKSFENADIERIRSLVLAEQGVLGIHDLKTRRSGIKPFIQFHLELDGNKTLFDAHVISDNIESKLLALFPGGEVIIHEDPVMPGDSKQY